MVSRKWLYSYRILLARLREGMEVSTARSAGLSSGSAQTEPRPLPVEGDLGEANTKPVLRLTAGGKV